MFKLKNNSQFYLLLYSQSCLDVVGGNKKRFRRNKFLFTIFFALLSACGGGIEKNGSDPRSTNPVTDKPIDPTDKPIDPIDKPIDPIDKPIDPIDKPTVEEPTPPAPFSSTWKIPASGKTITLPLVEDYNYNFTVDWGDGSPISEITSYGDPDKTHTYENQEEEKDYNLVIEGTLEAWSFNNTGEDKDKIISVENFGDLGYKNLSGAFYGCANLKAFEGGVTSAVTDMTSMFEGATTANPNVSNWDVSKVTNMANMFSGATLANPDVSAWVVSSVTDTGMTNLFNSSGLSTANYDAFLINLADNNASVENVALGAVGIYHSSDDAKTARDTLANDQRWTITDGGDYAAVFRSTWRIPTDGKTVTLPLVAGHNYNFTVNWGDGSPISEINAHDDQDITHTYANEGEYELLIAGLLEAWSFNNTGEDKDKIISVENFGDLGYKNLSGAFYGCANLGDFEGGITSGVTDMSSMFEGATTANPDVSNWDVSKVINMTNMFNGATLANPNVSGWVVSSVTDMINMFNASGFSTANYNAFLINLANNNALVENVALGVGDVRYDSFAARTALDALVDDRGWIINDGGGDDSIASFRSTWRVPPGGSITLPLVDDEAYTYHFTVDWGDGSAISRITSYADTDKTHIYTNENERDYNLVIKGTLEAWSFHGHTVDTVDKEKILSVESFGDLGYKNLYGAFHGCANLGDFEGGITSDVTDMRDMFYGAVNATPDMSNWNVSSVVTMEGMFSGADKANPDVSNWDVSSVVTMEGMFGGHNANPDVSNWDVSNVTNMRSMFSGATNATPDVSNWDVSKVTNMRYMFSGTAKANPDVSNWNVSNVTDMRYMFSSTAKANPDVSNWNVYAVYDMRSMFSDATNANPDMSSWVFSDHHNMSYMFNNSGLSTANYDALLINLADNTRIERGRLGAVGIKYSSDAAKTARDTLESRDWIIFDDGYAPPPPTPTP